MNLLKIRGEQALLNIIQLNRELATNEKGVKLGIAKSGATC